MAAVRSRMSSSELVKLETWMEVDVGRSWRTVGRLAPLVSVRVWPLMDAADTACPVPVTETEVTPLVMP